MIWAAAAACGMISNSRRKKLAKTSFLMKSLINCAMKPPKESIKTNKQNSLNTIKCLKKLWIKGPFRCLVISTTSSISRRRRGLRPEIIIIASSARANRLFKTWPWAARQTKVWTNRSRDSNHHSTSSTKEPRWTSNRHSVPDLKSNHWASPSKQAFHWVYNWKRRNKKEELKTTGDMKKCGTGTKNKCRSITRVLKMRSKANVKILLAQINHRKISILHRETMRIWISYHWMRLSNQQSKACWQTAHVSSILAKYLTGRKLKKKRCGLQRLMIKNRYQLRYGPISSENKMTEGLITMVYITIKATESRRAFWPRRSSK